MSTPYLTTLPGLLIRLKWQLTAILVEPSCLQNHKSMMEGSGRGTTFSVVLQLPKAIFVCRLGPVPFRQASDLLNQHFTHFP